jgi:hypothetical protein
MSNLKERLRRYCVEPLGTEAAARIEQLEAVLQDIIDQCNNSNTTAYAALRMADTARAALAPHSEKMT